MSKDPLTFEDPYLRQITSHFERIDPRRLESIKPYKKRHSRRHSETFAKFFAFEDFGYDRNIYLDSDIICLREAPLLTSFSEEPLLAALDSGFRKTRSYKGHSNEINSGVLAIDSSLQGRETVDQLIELAIDSPGRGGYNAGDQGILNKWIHNERVPLKILPRDYNLIKKDYSDLTGLDSCRLLHFCDRKPWFPLPSSDLPVPPLERRWHDLA